MAHNHAAFAREDVEDAQRGRPDFDLRAYAAARELRWLGETRPPGFSQVLPKFDDYAFNAMDGVLPGGLYGMLENELEEVELVENRGVGVGGELYGERFKFFGFLSRKYYLGPKNEPFDAQAAWIPATKVAIRLPQAALVPYLRVRQSDRASGHGVLDLADHGLPGFHLDGAEDWGRAERELAGAIFGGPAGRTLAAMSCAYIELRLDGGVMSLQRNGFVRGDTELDRLCEQVCAIAAGIRDAFAPRLSPRPFAQALPPPPWIDREVLPTEDSSHFDLQSSPWWETWRLAAEQLGMALESPEEYHRGFPSNPAVGRARAVLRGEAEGVAGPVRLAFHTVREVMAVRGVALFEAAPGARATVLGGEPIEQTDQFCSVVDGVAVFWNRTSTGGAVDTAELLGRSVRSARASGLAAT